MKNSEKEAVYNALMYLAECIEWGHIADIQRTVRQILEGLDKE